MAQIKFSFETWENKVGECEISLLSIVGKTHDYICTFEDECANGWTLNVKHQKNCIMQESKCCIKPLFLGIRVFMHALKKEVAFLKMCSQYHTIHHKTMWHGNMKSFLNAKTTRTFLKRKMLTIYMSVNNRIIWLTV
jgi:hypothetical protein